MGSNECPLPYRLRSLDVLLPNFLSSGVSLAKKGCPRASSSVILSVGLNSSIRRSRSKNSLCSGESSFLYVLKGWQFLLTYRPSAEVSSQINDPFWKYFCFLVLYTMRRGTGPRIFSIITKCSRLSCVWKRVDPV